ncbi:sensor domain-containing diguanylate cyclase [Litoribacillus peritrichatus]|uniref:diguanylate cyclase n=1 Tax=Litoribacillus peritrichatus TaxID=718191 RepID=A0ABP7LZW6_9GAMM
MRKKNKVAERISKDIVKSWHQTVDMVAQLLQVPVCMVCLVEEDACSPMVVNKSEENPFSHRNVFSFDQEFLCEWVVTNNKELMVADLRSEEPWSKSIMKDHDLVSFMGYPLHAPSGEVVGVFCVLDRSPRKFEEALVEIFAHFHQLTEFQLDLAFERHQLSHAQTVLEKTEELNNELSSRDSLTGAYNRRTLHELAVSELSRTTRKTGCFALVLLDVDHFKLINDEYGHLAGDAVLKHLVVSLSTMLRQSDFIARFGGEEFCLLMPEMDPSMAFNIIDRVRREVAKQPVSYNGETIYCTISLGCALFESGMITTVEELLNMADNALNEAKRTGRNRVCMASENQFSEAHSA